MAWIVVGLCKFNSSCKYRLTSGQIPTSVQDDGRALPLLLSLLSYSVPFPVESSGLLLGILNGGRDCDMAERSSIDDDNDERNRNEFLPLPGIFDIVVDPTKLLVRIVDIAASGLAC